MENAWKTHGMHGKRMDTELIFFLMHGKCMDIHKMHGKRMENAWKVHG